MAGMISKKGKRFGLWTSRYFELREQFLFYYEKETDETPKGSLSSGFAS
jgi:hypothetical protein